MLVGPTYLSFLNIQIDVLVIYARGVGFFQNNLFSFIPFKLFMPVRWDFLGASFSLFQYLPHFSEGTEVNNESRLNRSLFKFVP